MEDWYEWAVAPFMAAIPSLPVKLLGEVNSGLGLSMLPIFEDGDQSRLWSSVQIARLLSNIWIQPRSSVTLLTILISAKDLRMVTPEGRFGWVTGKPGDSQYV